MNELDEFCFAVLNEYMKNEIEIYRRKLGYHFDFDFMFMMFIKTTQDHEWNYGPGIRLRYDIIKVFENAQFNNRYGDQQYFLSQNYKNNRDAIREKRSRFVDTKYSIQVYDEDNELARDTLNYFQIYVIEHQDDLIRYFNKKYNT